MSYPKESESLATLSWIKQSQEYAAAKYLITTSFSDLF